MEREKEHGWSEVRRRKPATKADNGVVASFFVSNVPEKVTKGELRHPFATFGVISDIYFGNRKGKNGKNFAFVRFQGVKDVKQLEKEL